MILEEVFRFVHVDQLPGNGEASNPLLRFIKQFETQLRQVIRSVHIEGGTEFRRVLDFLHADGVKETTTTVHTSLLNGLSERRLGTSLAWLALCCSMPNFRSDIGTTRSVMSPTVRIRPTLGNQESSVRGCFRSHIFGYFIPQTIQMSHDVPAASQETACFCDSHP